jgi:hypothetical protein
MSGSHTPFEREMSAAAEARFAGTDPEQVAEAVSAVGAAAEIPVAPVADIDPMAEVRARQLLTSKLLGVYLIVQDMSEDSDENVKKYAELLTTALRSGVPEENGDSE